MPVDMSLSSLLAFLVSVAFVIHVCFVFVYGSNGFVQGAYNSGRDVGNHVLNLLNDSK
jgi:hypothetical protein